MAELNFKLWENADPRNHKDFVGYHCSERSSPNGRIVPSYGKQYFYEILDGLPGTLRDRALDMGLMNQPDDEYSNEFEIWAKEVADFLWENGIRWLFVSHDKPYTTDRYMGASYGNNCFYVLFPESNQINAIRDAHEIDATAYVYHVSRPPQLIPITDEV